MSALSDLAALAELCGILPRYEDMQGQIHVTSPDTNRSLLKALGVAAETDAEVAQSLAALRAKAAARHAPEEVIVESNKARKLAFGKDAAWSLQSDDTGAILAKGDAGRAIVLPALSAGVYVLSLNIDGKSETVRILVAPKRLKSVEDICGQSRLWGINLALYGLRSERNSGLGDFEDLSQMAGLAGRAGAAFVGVHPVHNMGFADDAFSPYSPSHRGFLNTSHIALDQIPGLESSLRAREVLSLESAQMSELRDTPDVAYARHKDMHSRILENLYAVFVDEANEAARDQLASFVQDAGPELQRFAKFESLSEVYGSDWRDWPDGELADPDQSRVQFHIWLQWVVDCQLSQTSTHARASGLPLGLYLDLAVGPRRSGAESWCEQDCIAQGVSIGAPPDHLSPAGQNWKLSAFAPQKLQAACYRPLRRILSQVMRHAGVVRIDHVLGLTRSFLIPDNGCPGGYIAQPMDALIAIIKIEAERHNCAVIGEDLGLVPENFRDTMRRHGFYGYSVLQYEKDENGTFRDPAKAPAQVLSCFATHDTPTVKGFVTGCDIKWWQHLGWIDADQALEASKGRAADVAALKRLAPPGDDFQSAMHALLARSPASLVSVQLDDILGVTEAQNLPGTIDQHPNWRRKYAVTLNELETIDGLQKISATMTRTHLANKEEKQHDISYS